MSIRQSLMSRWKRRGERRREWYVKIPQFVRGEIVAECGSVEAHLATWTRENRLRMAAINCVGIEFDRSGERHRWPWLEAEDTERAWWQAIA